MDTIMKELTQTGVCTNHAEVVGKIISPVNYHMSLDGIDYSVIELEIPRFSQAVDLVQVFFPTELMSDFYQLDSYIYVEGIFHSQIQDGKLSLFIIADHVEGFEDQPITYNRIELRGIVSKEPVYRFTPKGKRICDLTIQISEPGKETEYVPCVFWGALADRASDYQMGDMVHILGRIQSRSFNMVQRGRVIHNTVYEVSVSEIIR